MGRSDAGKGGGATRRSGRGCFLGRDAGVRLLNRKLECIRLRFRRVPGKYEKSATGARGGRFFRRAVNSRPYRHRLSNDQNGLTITRITIPTISTAGTSLMMMVGIV